MEDTLMPEFVRLESDGAVRHLVLASPERRNALNAQMLEEIAAAISAVAQDSTARALVVSGEGRAFCAGADLRSLFGDPTRPPAEIREDLKRTYGSFLGIADLRIPTVAAVDGVAVGAGVNIAMVCDIAIAGPRAKFAITFADIGLHPGGGCSWFLTRKLGSQRALAAVLGAETIDAATALRDGLVAELVENPTERALALAHTYAERDPALVRDMKRAVQMSETADLSTVLEFESWAQASSVNKPAFQEFMANFGASRREQREN
jgi:enoyl-CoA hydratase